MKQLKKRTLALVLASVVTVVGSYAQEHYKNSLMALEFQKGSSGTVNMVVQTKEAFSGSVVPVRKDATTFVLMLPEFNSNASTPDLSSVAGIESVSIKTLPYSTNGEGYTRITIKTDPYISLVGKHKIYIPNFGERLSLTDINYSSQDTISKKNKIVKNNIAVLSDETENAVTPPTESKAKNNEEIEVFKSSTDTKISASDFVPDDLKNNNNNTEGQSSVLFGILFVLLVSVFFFVRAKNKMSDIAGESFKFDDDEQEKNSVKKIKKTISKLDKQYSGNSSLKRTSASISSQNIIPTPIVSNSNEEEEEAVNIVDLDELFQDAKKANISASIESDDNSALDDFLNDFDFLEEEEEEPEINLGYDEELYEHVISNEKLKFNKLDLLKIRELLNNELTDTLMKERTEYLKKSPVKPKKTSEQRAEELITSYTVSQKIMFKEDEIKTLKSLVNFEMDADFVTDLRVDHERTKQMEHDILFAENKKKLDKEPQVLKVSDLLPNLEDVMLHPEKYEEKKETSKSASPDDLLKSLDNVQFKPFYDESGKTGETYIDLDEMRAEDSKIKPVEEKSVIEKNIGTEFTVKAKPKSFNNMDQNIVKKQSERIELNNRRTVAKTPSDGTTQKPKRITCILDGEAYKVICSINFDNNRGCHLAKNSSGYEILGYIGDQITKLRHFDSVESEKIYARLSEKISENEIRYLVKVGLNKFVISVEENCINFVMDL